MGNISKRKNQGVAIFSLALGILYLYFGVLEIVYWIGINVTFLSPVTLYSDAFAGFTLVITSLVFMTGAVKLWKNEITGYSYILVGLLLASVLGILQTLILAANWTERYLLANEDFAEWAWTDDFRASIPLWIISLSLVIPIKSLKIRKA
ncbi:MAG: hypothetical protein ACP6IS_11260 [Candidatus Asgardarchaeia archaeon]